MCAECTFFQQLCRVKKSSKTFVSLTYIQVKVLLYTVVYLQEKFGTIRVSGSLWHFRSSFCLGQSHHCRHECTHPYCVDVKGRMTLPPPKGKRLSRIVKDTFAGGGRVRGQGLTPVLVYVCREALGPEPIYCTYVCIRFHVWNIPEPRRGTLLVLDRSHQSSGRAHSEKEVYDTLCVREEHQ